MKPAPFEYFVPSTIDEALSLLNEHGYDAKILAGGQSLIPTMNFRLAQPAIIIDLNRVENLDYIKTNDENSVLIGAMTRHRKVEKSGIIAKYAPLLHETMPYIAHPQIRNRGTIGGSIVHADPAAELPAVMCALNAYFRIRSTDDERWVKASDFFLGMFATDMEPEELLMEIAIPALPAGSGWAFQEIARRHGDYALAGVAVVITLEEDEICKDARIVFLSVGDGPESAETACAAVIGKKLDLKLLEKIGEIAANDDIDPEADIHASADYRRHLAKIMAQRALKAAWERAKNNLRK